MKDKNLLDDNEGKTVAMNNEGFLRGNVALVGFEVLDPSERDIVQKMVENYVKKMNINGNFKEIRLSLRQHKHGKTFKHEIDALAIFSQGRFEAESTEWNLYIALSQVCDRILSEIDHNVKKEQRHDKKVMQ